MTYEPIHDHMHYENGKLVDDPYPVPEPDVAGLDAYDPFYSDRQRFYSAVHQQVESSEEYPVDPIWQEDYMLERLDGLLEERVITDSEHMRIFASWISKRRPDTAVLRVQPKPRGYGRGYLNE